MTLKEYGIDSKKIPLGFWKKLVKKYCADNYEWWCLDEAILPYDGTKSAFQFLWREDDWTYDYNPYTYLEHIINTHLDKGEEIPQFIQKLRK